MKSIRQEIDQNLREALHDLRSGNAISEGLQEKVVHNLQQANEQFHKLTTWIALAEEIADLGAWEHDIKNNELYWSDETYRILGFEPLEVKPGYEVLMQRMHPDDRDSVNEAFQDSLENHLPYQVIYRVELPKGKVKYVEAHARHFYDESGDPVLTIGTNQDVTKRELEKKKIEESLEENRTLLGEIHHRLKNNLAVVAGMLQLQWLQEDDPQIIQSLQESTNRIKAVSGIHQQLYQSGNFANIDLGQNITKLASDLIHTMETSTKVNLESDFDTIFLNMKQTLPCTLIANEVVTNAVKHAFNGRDTGTIRISLQENNGRIELSIFDNGLGFPEDFEDKKGSLGMNLINTLSDQLEGDYSFSSKEQGTTFNLTFDKA